MAAHRCGNCVLLQAEFLPLPSRNKHKNRNAARTQIHSRADRLDFSTVVALKLYTDCIDPYIGGEQGNTACK